MLVFIIRVYVNEEYSDDDICNAMYLLLVMLKWKSPTKVRDERILYEAVLNNNKDEVERLIAKGVSSTEYKNPMVSKLLTFIFV